MNRQGNTCKVLKRPLNLRGCYKRPKGQMKKESFSFCLEKAWFLDENGKDIFEMLNDWSREPLGDMRNQQQRRKKLRLSICVNDTIRFDVFFKLLLLLSLFYVRLQIMNKCCMWFVLNSNEYLCNECLFLSIPYRSNTRKSFINKGKLLWMTYINS